jgi:hypothetical protein
MAKTDSMLEEVPADKRGYLKLLKFGEYEALLSYTLKGKSRSGYYFKVDRVYIVLSGSFEYMEKNIENGNETKKIIKTGDHFTVKPGDAHMFTALEDTYMIEFTPGVKGKIEMIPYKPYREICEKDM